MVNNLAVKKNNSSIQVLKTLLMLLEGDYTMLELIEKLNSNEKECIFNNSVVSKYINTCRQVGIDIPKINNKYFIVKLPFGLNFTNRESELIDYLQSIGDNKFSLLFKKRLSNFIDNLRKYSSRNIMRVDVSVENTVRTKFEEAVCEHRQVRLIYKTREIIDCNPIDIIMEKGKIYFVVNYMGKEKHIAFERITGLEVLNKKFVVQETQEQEVVFKLKGGLAKRYSLRENEILTEKAEDYIVITNKGEDKEILISRLLRYDSLCEVLEPLSFRNEMVNTIKKMLENYGE